MSDQKLFGIVCATMLQGQTINTGDIYLTQADADAERADMIRMRAAAIGSGDIDDEDPEDDGFAVIEIIVKEDGTITDNFEEVITVTDTKVKSDVLKAVAELHTNRPLTELQKTVLTTYANGEFAHLETIGQTRGRECGDTLVEFLMAEAEDAAGDPAQLAQQIGTAIRQLQDLQHELLHHNEQPRQRN